MVILIILAFAILLFVTAPFMFKIDKLTKEMDTLVYNLNAYDMDTFDSELERFKGLVHKYQVFNSIVIASYAAVAILTLFYINL